MERKQAEVGNAADPRQTKKAGRRAERRLEDFENAVREVLGTPAGRRLFGDHEHGLLARAGLYRTTFAPDAAIYYNAGQHAFALEMFALIQRINPEGFLLMQREARVNDERADAEALAAIQRDTDADTDEE
jgi:hypothetical protein